MLGISLPERGSVPSGIFGGFGEVPPCNSVTRRRLPS